MNLKKSIARVLIVLHLMALIVPLFAASTLAPGAITSGVYEWSGEKFISGGVLSTGGSSFPDTLTGTGDSTLIVKNYPFASGFEYSLVRGPATTTLTTGDSVVYRADFKDINKNYLFSIYFDTVVAASAVGGSVMLPVNRQAYTPYVSIVAKSLAALSTRNYITSNLIFLNKRRPLNINQAWK